MTLTAGEALFLVIQVEQYHLAAEGKSKPLNGWDFLATLSTSFVPGGTSIGQHYLAHRVFGNRNEMSGKGEHLDDGRVVIPNPDPEEKSYMTYDADYFRDMEKDDIKGFLEDNDWISQLIAPVMKALK